MAASRCTCGGWGWHAIGCAASDRELRPAKSAIADVHRARIDLVAVNLRNLLKAQATDGCANPNDTQLLAALDRWTAGELV